MQPEPESEISIDTLGGLSDSEDELKAVLQARDALERRLMLISPGQRHWQPLKTEPAGFGNIVGVGIGEKEAYGRPTGRVVGEGVRQREAQGSKMLPSEARVPRSLGGVETDVERHG